MTSVWDSGDRAARRGRMVRWAQFSGAVAVAAAAIGAAVWLAPRWWPVLVAGAAVQDGEAATPEAAGDEASATEVTLGKEKLATAGIEVGQVRMRPLGRLRTTAGRLDYDHSRHLEMKAPAAAVVKEVLVEPGERVAAGQKLAVLVSSEIGLARDKVLAQQAELRLAQRELAFHEEVAAHVHELLDGVRKTTALAELEKRFEGRTLGEFRETIITAYGKLKLAEAIAASTADLTQSGAVSGRLAEQRKLDREVAAAGFAAACEQAEFAARIARDRAAATVAQAERLLKVSQEGVAALLGPYGAAEPADDAALSEFTMCAPYAATVSERLVTPSERIALAQLVFVLANNDRLWVAAEIFERDWQLLALRPGAALEVTMPAFPGRTFAATVRHIGATVNTQTRSVPLVAEIENAEGLLKPGMFAWVTLPAEEIRPRPAVPAEAVVRHEDQPFVFVPSGEATFRRVDVALGVETPEWVEVTSGLRAGDRVVTKGAFFLKSELLLQHEE